MTSDNYEMFSVIEEIADMVFAKAEEHRFDISGDTALYYASKRIDITLLTNIPELDKVKLDRVFVLAKLIYNKYVSTTRDGAFLAASQVYL